MPEKNAPQANRLARRAAHLTDQIDTLLRKKETLALQRDRLWAEASALGMAHTTLADVANLHHSQVDRGVQRAQEQKD